MEIYDRVQKLVKEQGLTIRQLETDCGLSNATVRRWVSQVPNIESVRKVAQRLNVTLDYLVTGNSLNTTSAPLVCDGVPLSESEADLIAMFRLLPGDHQEDVYEIVRSKYDRLVEKKGSYYSACIEAEEVQESGPAESREARDGTA